MADGLAGAVGQGVTDDGAIFVEIMHPDNGRPMFCIGKEQGRYIVRGSGGDRLAVGPSLNALFAYSNYSGAPDRPTLRLVDWTH
ncbi:MAG: hypothetical protein GKS00_09640 [Alphaproteobacteria bacterium]|nr:hypothetical protein [Alphaproteobacteria bacterium]